MGQGSPEKGLTSCCSFVPLLLRLWLHRDRDTDGCGDVLCATPCPPPGPKGTPTHGPDTQGKAEARGDAAGQQPLAAVPLSPKQLTEL